MDTLNKALGKYLSTEFNLKKVVAVYIARELKNKGVNLDNEQIETIEKVLHESSDFVLSFCLEESQIVDQKLNSKDAVEGIIANVICSLTDRPEEFELYLENLLSDVVMSSAKDIVPIVKSNLTASSKKAVKLIKKEEKKINDELYKIWGPSIGLLEDFIFLVRDVFCETAEYIERVEEMDFLNEAYLRLCARACQISSEILVLLKGGYADGAHARWRSLHEIAVTVTFLSNHGRDAAERYFCHDAVETFKAAVIYQESCVSSGAERLTEKEMEELKRDRDRQIDRFGEKFRHEYGWAAICLGRKKVTFRDLEESVSFDYMRYYYRVASGNIHASPGAVFSRLGLLPEHEDSMLIGPSVLGLGLPGGGTAASLFLSMIPLLSHVPTLDNIVLTKVLMEFNAEVSAAFDSIELVAVDD